MAMPPPSLTREGRAGPAADGWPLGLSRAGETRRLRGLTVTIGALLAGAALISILLALTAAGGWGIEGSLAVIRPWLANGVYATCAAAMLLRAFLNDEDRWTWAAFGSAFLLWFAGFTYWSVALQGDSSPPVPSPSDAFWLGFFPLCGLALYALLSGADRPRLGPWFDAVLMGLVTAAVGAAFILPGLLDTAGGSRDALLVALAYPLGDLFLLVVLVAGIGDGGWRRSRSSRVVAALALLVVTDAGYLYATAHGVHPFGGPLDAGWQITAVLIASAAWFGGRPAEGGLSGGRPGRRATALPTACVCGAIGLLVVGNLDPLPPIALVFALMTLVAGLARIGLALRDRSRLDELAHQDPLTGLANRRHLEASVERELGRCRRRDDRLSVVLIDLDRFKDVNDRRGHGAGDAYLQRIALRLRHHDGVAVAGRLGGDEFLLLMPGQCASAAIERATELQAATDEAGLPFSFGVAEYPVDGVDLPMLSQVADARLYEQKRGRHEIARAKAGAAATRAAADPAACDPAQIVMSVAADLFSRQLELQPTLEAVAASARRALGADRATCYEHSLDGSAISAVHTTETDARVRDFLGDAIGRGRADMPLWDALLRQGEPVWAVEDVAADPGVPPALRRGLRAGAFLGIRLEDPSVLGDDGRPTLLGTLFVSFRSARAFGDDERRTALSLASLAGLALANTRLHDETRHHLVRARAQAGTDHLTGLGNHRSFHERLRWAVDNARQDGGGTSVVVLDIDDFRTVNEGAGHEIGDRVLVEAARRLAGAVAGGDTLARLGADEFAILVRGGPGEALAQAEAACCALARAPLAGVSVSASAGVCDLLLGHGPEEWMRLARGALYWAKTHQRGTAVVYAPEVVRELSAAERVTALARSQARIGLRALARSVDARDRSTQRHSERVAELAGMLATESGWSASRTASLRESALVHDVGKIALPDAILLKPSPLTEEEYATVKEHSARGAEIVEDILPPEQVAWVRGHHERWDGRGYPDALSGAAIPDGARLLALADAWDAMVASRPYGTPRSVEDALGECRREAGRQFCPDAVEALERIGPAFLSTFAAASAA